MNIIMSEEAVKEIDDYLNSPVSMVDTNGKLIRDLDTNRAVQYAFFCVSYHPLD